MPAASPFGDFLRQLLEEEPRLPYNAALNTQNLSPNQRRWGQNAYNDIWGQYLGRLGQQIQGNQNPTLRFTDFLAETPFAERFAAQPQEFRGEFPQRFSPRTRWLTNF